jgi:hypothetical protein
MEGATAQTPLDPRNTLTPAVPTPHPLTPPPLFTLLVNTWQVKARLACWPLGAKSMRGSSLQLGPGGRPGSCTWWRGCGGGQGGGHNSRSLSALGCAGCQHDGGSAPNDVNLEH